MKTKEKYWKQIQAINSLWLGSLISFEEKLKIERKLEKAYSNIKKQ